MFFYRVLFLNLMSERTYRAICTLLDSRNISYEVMVHEPVSTSKDAAQARGRGVEEGLRRSAKALILRSQGTFYQFVIPGDAKLDMKKAKLILGTKRLSLASHEEVRRITDCTPGSVPPFGNLWGIPVYADARLGERIDFSAGLHEKSMTIERRDWEKVVAPVVVDVVR